MANKFPWVKLTLYLVEPCVVDALVKHSKQWSAQLPNVFEQSAVPSQQLQTAVWLRTSYKLDSIWLGSWYEQIWLRLTKNETCLMLFRSSREVLVLLVGFLYTGQDPKPKPESWKLIMTCRREFFRRWLSEHGWPDLFAQGTPRNSYEYLFYWEEYEPWYFRVPYFQTSVKCQNH